MPKTKVALTLEADLIDQVDELVGRRRFRSRSQAVEAALAGRAIAAKRGERGGK